MTICNHALFMSAALALGITSLSVATAEEPCHAKFNAPRLDVTMPTGCMTSAIIKRQIDNPDDLIIPRTETEADIARRIKTLSDWRNGKGKSDNASEGQK